MPHRRPYRDSDVPALQEAAARWAAEAGPCGYPHPGDVAHRIYDNLRGRAVLGQLVQVWEEAGEVVGFAITCRFDSAFDVFAAPALRGTPAELAMIDAAVETTTGYLVRTGSADPVQTDVAACDELRQKTLAALGFERYRVWDQVRRRSLAEPAPAPQLPPGYAIRGATLADAAQLAEVRNDAFYAGHASWTAEQYRDEVMVRPGYDPAREIVAVDPAGRVAALAVTWLDARGRAGLFEPVATRSDSRRLGLARAVMLAGLAAMRAAGMESAAISHDATNAAAAALYASLGFEVQHETLGFRRD